MTMCKMMEDMRKESEARGEARGVVRGAHDKAIQTAQNMLTKNMGSHEDIAEVTGLTLDEVKTLAGEKSA